MTLILTVNGPETIWLLADRRLTYSDGRPPKNDACKLMFLGTGDATAILGYAGLGATATGTEPAHWMSRVLRGRNLPFVQSLDVLADATRRELGPHLTGIDPSIHNTVATAFVQNKARLYTIDVGVPPPPQHPLFRYIQHVHNKPSHRPPRPPRVFIAGSGAGFLMKEKSWLSPLLGLVRDCDRGRKKMSPEMVSDYLAGLNQKASGAEPTVGPRCIVAWRNRKGSVHKTGGDQRFYNGLNSEKADIAIPNIGSGQDWNAVLAVFAPHVKSIFESMGPGKIAIELDKNKVNAELVKLPDTPDEKLT